MAEILEVSDWEFKITKINMLRTVMEKLDNMQGQMDNISKEMEALRIKGNARNQKHLSDLD